MSLRDFRFGWRLLVKEPGYSAVSLLGLAVGFAVCFMLLSYVHVAFSYDSGVPEADRLFAVKERINIMDPPIWVNELPVPLCDFATRTNGAALSTIVHTFDVRMQAGPKANIIPLSLVDPAFASLFGVRVLEGDLQASLNHPDEVALSTAVAVKLFGSDTSALGKTVRIDKRIYRIGAVVATPSSSTTQTYSALAGPSSAAWSDEERKKAANEWGSTISRLYLKLGPHASPAALTETLQSAFDHSPVNQHDVASATAQRFADIALTPVSELHFDPDFGSETKTTVLGLAAVALAILLLAASNYVNLATMRAVRRQREIGTRKVLGAGKVVLARQFMLESVLMTLLATCLGLGLAWLTLPALSDLINKELDAVFTFTHVAVALAGGVLVGLLAGIYPAVIALRAPAGLLMSGHGDIEARGGKALRSVLTVLQFATAMGLSAVCLTVLWQTRYAAALGPGFDPAPLLVMELPGEPGDTRAQPFRDQLTHLPGVTGVTAAWQEVGFDYKKMAASWRTADGREFKYSIQPVSNDFFDVYRVAALAGRVFNPRSDRQGDDTLIVINRSAALASGYASPQAAIGQLVDGGRVIGVIADLRHQSARAAPQATIYKLSIDTPIVTVRVAGDSDKVRASIDALWRQHFPNDVLDLRSAQSILAYNYVGDLRMAKTLGIASCIAGLLAAFGIYVFASYSVQRRMREIALRKLFGASGAAIVRLIGRDVAAAVLAGAMIGLPLAYLAGAHYLASFVERAPIGVWTLGAALMAALLVACAATLRQIGTALHVAPARILRA